MKRKKLRLLHEVLIHGLTSTWAVYIDTLPREFPTQPLWYSPAEQALLSGTFLDVMLAGGHMADECDLEAISKWCASQDLLFPAGGCPDVAALRWAASVVASRAFDSVAWPHGGTKER